MLVDPKTGVAAVAFKEGFSYLYKNVDTKAIQALLRDKDVSVDEWVNKNLKKAQGILLFSLQEALIPTTQACLFWINENRLNQVPQRSSLQAPPTIPPPKQGNRRSGD